MDRLVISQVQFARFERVSREIDALLRPLVLQNPVYSSVSFDRMRSTIMKAAVGGGHPICLR